jgi:hypothetical protein
MDCCIALVLRITAPDVRADFVATGLITQADTEQAPQAIDFQANSVGSLGGSRPA